ncbi:uncharacterized protein LOC110755432 [Prunus avium]|uniref:Uncharacterized protein LOC110755432 n=1 Tax=Prunus avium TaxID=42229 RepID=A0A6P5SD64_PRUAV|nr:uncharacterized protein LOC110755432 [Prunus avium]
MVGAVMNFSSYYLLHEVTRRSIRFQLWQICACVFVGNNAQNFTHTAALVTCVQNFPEKRGIVIGLLKVFLMIVTLCERFFTFPRIGYVRSGVVILFLLALPLLIAIREERFILSLKQQPDNRTVAINAGSTTEGAVVLPDAGQSQQDILMQNIGLAKGFVSELLLKQKGTPRPLMNVFALLLSCLGVLMATVIIGFSYGAQVTLLCTITSEIFGLKYYATLVNCTQFATPLGWFLLDNKLTQPMYHLEAKRLNMGALASYVLARRTAKFYKGDVYKKFKDGKYKSFKVQAKATETERASSSDQ